MLLRKGMLLHQVSFLGLILQSTNYFLILGQTEPFGRIVNTSKQSFTNLLGIHLTIPFLIYKNEHFIQFALLELETNKNLLWALGACEWICR